MRKIAALALAAAGAVLFSGAVCAPKAPPSEWNLLWIVIDDLKAGHLGAAGYDRDVTPALDRLARQGVRFERCVTQSPWSLPSFASMFTSRYPWRLVMGDAYLMHVRAETDVARSRDPYRMPEMNTHWYVPVSPDAVLLAELLGSNGFETAGWVNNAWLSPGSYGLERGFVQYYDGVGAQKPYTPADRTAELAAEWISGNAAKRWFAFVHFMDPHKPYLDHEGIDFGGRLIDRYDEEIAFTDRAVARLLEELDRLDLTRRTVVVVNADHGEGVFARDVDFVGHGGGVIPEIVFVPLIMRWPGGPDGRVAGALCRNLDIMPTVLDLIGINGSPDMEGRSLLAEARGRQKLPPEPAVTMGLLKGPELISMIEPAGEPGAFFQALATPAYHKMQLIALAPGKMPQAVPLNADPELISKLDAFVRSVSSGLAERPRGMPPKLDEKTRAGLKALGYLQ